MKYNQQPSATFFNLIEQIDRKKTVMQIADIRETKQDLKSTTLIITPKFNRTTK
jgi:hypothetical protein